MKFTPPGRLRSAAEFAAVWRELAPDLGCDERVEGAAGALGQPLVRGSRRIGNRFAVHPMEGWDAEADGTPSEHTLRRWYRFGRSGAKLVWGGEAFAVREDGRANPNQLFLGDSAAAEAGLVALRKSLLRGHHEAGFDAGDLYLGLQLTHSGRFARPAGGPRPRIAHRHPILDRRLGIDDDTAVLTDGELEAIALRFVEAARLAERAGFEFVDVKCCHGYLLHELLAARTRPGRYGGSLANRVRLVGEIIAAIGSGCPRLDVAVRLSVFDSVPFAADPDSGRGRPEDHDLPYAFGFGVDTGEPTRPDLAEPWQLLASLQERGVWLVNLTAGSPYYCPHLQRPAAYPPSDGYPPPEDPLLAVAAQIRAVRACKAAFPDLVLVGTGYSYLQEYVAHVAQHEVAQGHVDFVGLGRMMLSYPELPADVLAGRPLRKRQICRTLSDCTSAPRNGLRSGCYPLDPHYKGMPEAALLRQLKRGGGDQPKNTSTPRSL